jgi:biopolymer transport protein ExbB
MLNLLYSGGFVMIPLILCSILAVAIVIERSWQLRYNNIVPNGLSDNVIQDFKNNTLNKDKIMSIKNSSALGELLAVGLKNIARDRNYLLAELEDTGRRILHNLERHLNMLGIIATITPLLGLLGTVFGMIKTFNALNMQTISNSNMLAGGIAEALITTAAGLCIAIPSVIFYRSFQRRLDEIAHRFEHEAVKFVDNVKP